LAFYSNNAVPTQVAVFHTAPWLHRLWDSNAVVYRLDGKSRVSRRPTGTDKLANSFIAEATFLKLYSIQLAQSFDKDFEKNPDVNFNLLPIWFKKCQFLKGNRA